eukprot:TCONS_00026809-protein
MAIGRHILCSTKSTAGKRSILLEQRNGNDVLLLEQKVTAALANTEAELVKKQYEKAVEAYACLGVLKFHLDEDECLMYLFFVTGCTSIGKIGSTDIFRISNCSYVAFQEPHPVDSRINDVQKLLMNGCFYFPMNHPDEPYNFNLLLSVQRQQESKDPDNRFFWNRNMHDYLYRFGIDCARWFVKIICGGVEIRTIYVGAKQAKACLISRLSCERAGTRFNVRGTNDDGHVANFVETEQVIFLENTVTSFIQTRGSVPLFWEQPGVQVGSHKVKLSRGYEASSAAFDRHLSTLKRLYGYQLLINLLGSKEGEAILSQAFRNHLKDSKHNFDTHMIVFDYHRHCTGSGKQENLKGLLQKAKPSIENFQFFSLLNGDVIKTQCGTIRSNCLDCLDRTNAVQTEIGMQLLLQQLESIGLTDPQLISRFSEAFKSLWHLNGDHNSRIYSGTGAMEVGTRNTFASKIHDGAVSVKRTIKNNFFDGSKQEAIDILLLGNVFTGPAGERARALLRRTFLHSSPSIMRDICLKYKSFTTTNEFRVSVGTWNVNGGKHFRSLAYKHQSLHDWLIDHHKHAPEGIIDQEGDFLKPSDMYVIGFEELVDLNTSNIISTSSTNKKEWASKLQEMISRDHQYILVTTEQLVGVCLFVFIRTKHAPYVRDVAIQTIKTGLKGKAGNKGAVAIRMLVHSTSLCFIAGHFAAGQSNFAERNQHYHDISRRIQFPMGSELSSHDYVFWCGDFNYRIDVPNAQCKELVKEKAWAELLSNDQLLLQKAEGKVFKGFNEGPINFAPTYKYDLFSDDYDTSEKMRTPAWTDRVLWRRSEATGIDRRPDDEDDEEDIPPEWRTKRPESSEETTFNPGRIVYYGRAEMKTSDHRPVMAVIDIEIEKVLPNKLGTIHQEVMTSYGPADPTIIVSIAPDEQDVEVDLEEVMEELDNYGNVVLLRLIDDDLHVTFESGVSALEALELDGRVIGGHHVSIVLRSSELLEHTDQAILQMVSSPEDDLQLQDDEEGDVEADEWREAQRKGSCLLTRSGSIHAAVLEPEKLHQQEDYLDDIEETEASDDDVIDDVTELSKEQLETLRRESFSQMPDSDEEDQRMEKSPKPPRQSKPPPPSRPAMNKKPAPPSRPSNAPTRPSAPSAIKPNLSQKDIDELVGGSAPAPTPAPSRPSRPSAPSRPSPAGRPPPPRPAPAASNRPTPAKPPPRPTSTDTQAITPVIVESKEDDVGNPFNIQHLMHVDKNNIDDFIAMMKQQYATENQTPVSSTANDVTSHQPKRRGTMMSKMKASIRRDTKTQAKPTPVISGPSDMRKTDGADMAPLPAPAPVPRRPTAEARPPSTTSPPPPVASQKPAEKKRLLISGPSDPRPLDGNTVSAPPPMASKPPAKPSAPQRPTAVRRPSPPSRPSSVSSAASSQPNEPPARPVRVDKPITEDTEIQEDSKRPPPPKRPSPQDKPTPPIAPSKPDLPNRKAGPPSLKPELPSRNKPENESAIAPVKPDLPSLPSRPNISPPPSREKPELPSRSLENEPVSVPSKPEIPSPPSKEKPVLPPRRDTADPSSIKKPPPLPSRTDRTTDMPQGGKIQRESSKKAPPSRPKASPVIENESQGNHNEELGQSEEVQTPAPKKLPPLPPRVDMSSGGPPPLPPR